MTAGEMLGYTKRLNAILGGYMGLRDQRLSQLMTDLEQAYNIPMLKDEQFEKENPFLMSLYRAVSDERSI